MSKLALHHGKAQSRTEHHGTLADLFMRVATQYPLHGMRFIETSGEESFLSYPALLREAQHYLSGIWRQGLRPGDIVILVVNHDLPAFYKIFWACMLGGLVVAPVSQPTFENDSPTLKKLKHIWQILNKPLVVVEDRYQKYFTDLSAEDDFSGVHFLSVAEVPQDHITEERHVGLPTDLAILQFSSGSTGYPKGVQLTHRNIMTNLSAMGRGFELTPADQVFTWLPHTHDMGLFFQYLAPLAIGANLYVFSPMTFTRAPYLFLKKVTDHRGTWFGSPNFGLDWMVKSISDEQLATLELSSLRFILNGAEPVSASVMRAFYEKFSRCGLQDHRMRCAYGMAEVTVCATVTPPMQSIRVDVVDRRQLINSHKAQSPVTAHSEHFSLVHVGYPVDDISLRVVDKTGKTVCENQIGEIQIKGPSVTTGYYNAQPDAPALFADGWLHTGDLGYMRDGSLVIVGRMKDIIFVRGQNYFAHDLEETLFKLGMVARGNLLITGHYNHQTEQEELLVFVKHKGKLAGFLDLSQRIRLGLRKAFGLNAMHILPVNTIPKTTSGKLQRHVLQKNYQNGVFDKIIVQLQMLELSCEVPVANTEIEHTTLEKKVRQIWSDLLKVPEQRITIDANFFVLGGNSLKAFQLLDALSQSMQCNIDPEILALCSTVRQMADYLQSRHSTKNDRMIVQNKPSAAVAITGMAFKLPGANTQQELWKNLSGKKNNIRRISEKRKKMANHPEWNDWMAALSDIDCFDDVFFGVSEQEAQVMDPQQRLVLEAAYHALEDAGLTQDLDSEQPIGVYSGTSMNTYLPLVAAHVNKTKEAHQHTLVGNLCNVIPARLSSVFNFTGPSLAIDTACSSFLVAMHHAVLALRQGSLTGALVTSSNILVTPEVHTLSRLAGILGKGNKVKVFDHKASGTALGEGVIVFYLERVEDALKNNKHIYGVIRGSAVNNDGGSYNIMAPNPNGQYQVLETAYADAGLSPSTISYLEVHGTGTVVGDFIEVNTLSKLFAKQADAKKNAIGIGSVKTNMGHLLPAASGVGLAKILLSLQYKQLLPQLHFRKPSPILHLDQSPFYVVDHQQAWDVDAQTTRKAGLSSFGLGGTNAHMVIEEWDNAACDSESAFSVHLLALSAKTEAALHRVCQQMKSVLAKQHALKLSDLCFTRNRYRKHYDYRAAYMVCDRTRQIIKTVRYQQLCRRPPTIALVMGEFSSVMPAEVQQWIDALCSYLKDAPVIVNGLDTKQADTAITFDRVIILGNLKPRWVAKYCHELTKVTRVSLKAMLEPDKSLLSLMANLYVAGVNFKWEVVHPNGSGKMVHLPLYPFESRSHWVSEIGG